MSRCSIAALDVGDDLGDLRAPVGLSAIFDIHPDGLVVFADAIDAPGDAHLGAERGCEEALEDLGVGEGLALGGAAFGDFGIFGRLRERAEQRDEKQTARGERANQVAEESREERA